MKNLSQQSTQSTQPAQLKGSETSIQYSVGPIQFHGHNGADATPLNLRDFAQLDMSRGAYFTREVDNLTSGTAKKIDWTLGNKQKITTTGSCTLTFNNPIGPCNIVLRIIHNNSATAYTYTYPSTAPGKVYWPNGVKPTTTNTANAIDVITFYYDGANYWGAGLTNFS